MCSQADDPTQHGDTLRAACTCKPPDGVTRNHANGCALFDVDVAFRQGYAAALAASATEEPIRCYICGNESDCTPDHKRHVERAHAASATDEPTDA